MEKQKYRLPNWAVLTIAIVVGLAVFWVTRLDTENIEKRKQRIETLNKEIDSLRSARKNDLKKIVINSQSQADKAQGLIKTLQNEKPIIRDTTYDAMCDYITNYPGQP